MKVPSAKELGIILDEKLDGKEHIEAVTASLAKITNSLKIVKNFIPHKNKHLLYVVRWPCRDIDHYIIFQLHEKILMCVKKILSCMYT